MRDIVLLVAGMSVAAAGGEIFVRGIVRVAERLRVPVGVVGVTVAAFATSAPEMAVGVNAALAGTPQVAAGDALGSNVVNIALVLGAVMLAAPLRLERQDVRRDLPFAVAAPLLIGLVAVDGWLSRVDGFLLITVFLVWMATAVRAALRARDGSAAGAHRGWRAAGLTVLGVTVLLIAGRMVVVAAEGIGEMLRLDPFLVGATLVALGTSMPELATVTVARLRRHGSLGAGTVMGSNIFNSLWIVGGIAVLQPFHLGGRQIVAAVVAGSVAALALIPSRDWTLGRGRGALLIAGYGLYLLALMVGARPPDAG